MERSQAQAYSGDDPPDREVFNYRASLRSGDRCSGALFGQGAAAKARANSRICSSKTPMEMRVLPV